MASPRGSSVLWSSRTRRSPGSSSRRWPSGCGPRKPERQPHRRCPGRPLPRRRRRGLARLVEPLLRYVHAIAVQAFRLPPEDAEDVFQDVFARVYERLDSLREDDARPPLDRAAHPPTLHRPAPLGRGASRTRTSKRSPTSPPRTCSPISRTPSTCTRRWPIAGELPGRSWTASSPRTRATARSGTPSASLRARSRVASPAASTSFERPSREEMSRLYRQVSG